VLSVSLVGALAVAGCAATSAPPHATSPSRVARAAHHVVITTARTPWRLREPLSRLVAVPDRGRVLLAGGLDSADASTGQVSGLDVATGTVTPRGAVPDPFHDAAAATVAGHLVVFGGGAASSSAAVQSIGQDAAGQARGRVIGTLPQPRSDLSAVTIGTHVYLLGGYTGTTELPSILATTDGTSFRTVGTLPVTVRYAATVAVGSTIWVFGGEHGSHPVRDIQRFETSTGRTSVVGKLPGARSDAVAMIVGGRVLVAGGRDAGGHVLAGVEELDPATATVHRVARLRAAVADPAVVVVGDTAYLIGGERHAPVSVVQTIRARAVTEPSAG
jgi:N-acetylneuraminic acid mutarotase